MSDRTRADDAKATNGKSASDSKKSSAFKMQSDDLSGKAFDRVLLKRLMHYVRPHRGLLLMSSLITIATAMMSPIRPFLTHLIIDNYVAKGDYDGLTKLSILLFVVLLLEAVLQYGATYLTQLLGQKAILALREDLFRHLQKLSLKFFDKNPIGRLITRTTNDVESLNEMLSSGLVALLGDIFQLSFIVIMMLYLDWRLTLLTLGITLPMMIYGSFLFRTKVRKTYQDVRTQIARLNAFLQEHITGISTIQLFNRETKEFHGHAEINALHRDANIRSIFYYAVFYPAVEFIGSLSLGIMIWYGGLRALDGTITIGILVAFIQYVQAFFRPIQDLSDKYNIMQTAMTSGERIFKLLDEKVFIEKPQDHSTLIHTLPDVKGDIKFENVWFAYNGEPGSEDWILKDVSFEVKSGQTLAIVGATGSGKTTIISLLSRFYDIQKGRILLDGTDIRLIDERELRRKIAVVLQDVFLFSGSIYENITLGDDRISEAQVRAAADSDGAERFISRLPQGYHYKVQERGGTLSTGERQLLSFVRAMVYEPRILVLDEATSSVDSGMESLIQQATDKLMHSRTSIIIAHRLSTIQTADNILVLHKGVVMETGNHQALLAKNGLYYKLYQLQYKDQEVSRTKQSMNR
jgi:ATP-binding cassette subfamily B multidrug efflux pump